MPAGIQSPDGLTGLSRTGILERWTADHFLLGVTAPESEIQMAKIIRRRTRTRPGEEMSQFDKDVNELLARAMQQPGVAEVMAIYEGSRDVTANAQKSMNSLQPQWVYQSTNTSSGS